MNHSGTLSPGRIRSALYVDFDNIFLNLQATDRRAAEVFATDPLQWLTWIERGMPTDRGQESPLEPRGTLLRRCYLNPDTFRKYRTYFTLAAFSVIDCPSLTARGKNSADILMVMDIMDALSHPVRIDEFIILSSDADFTPVMLRLRAHDRRTTMLNIGMAVQAYKAASGTVIEYGDFIEHGLRVVSRPEPKAGRDRLPELHDQDGLVQRLGRRLSDEVKAEGDVAGSRIPEIFKEVNGFRNSNWGGFFSLRRLAEEIVRRNAGLRLTEDDLSWRVVLSRSTAPLAPLVAVERPGEASVWGELRQQILHFVRERVAQSPAPLSMASVAHEVIRQYGSSVLDSGWAGAGTFKDLLTGVEDLEFVVYQPTGMHAVLWDPARHGDLSNDLMSERLSHLPDALRDFARRISQVTGAPLLMPEEFRALFQALEQELKVNNYALFQTSKAVRDRCIEQGFEIARKSVNFVLQGIAHTGHRFDDNPLTDHAENFAEMTRENLVALCQDAQLPLTAQELDMLAQWIPGGRSTIEKQELEEDDPLEVPVPVFTPKMDDDLEVTFLDE